MDSEFRLCPACRAPNTVQDAACASCGQPLPAVGKAPAATFDAIPGRQEARQAAGSGVRRGLLVGIVSAAVLGLLVARTLRSPSLQDAPVSAADEATPAPAAAAEPRPAPLAPAVPVAPAGIGQPNPYSTVPAYSNPGEYVGPSPYSQVALLTPSASASPSPSPSAPARTPAMIIAAPEPGTAPSTSVTGSGGKPGSYTDADLERVRNEAARDEGAQPASTPEARPEVVGGPARRPAPAPERESRLQDRREAVRDAQRRVAEAQRSVDDIRREARENDDDGLQEELQDALSELKSAQRDLVKAQRKLQEAEGRAVLPPQ